MTYIDGIVVNLDMGDNGTDDHIYIGVVGTGGGREFPLNTKGFDDFEANSSVTYAIGEIWDGAAISDPNLKRPENSDWANSPSRYLIEFENVTQVYIRKGGTRRGDRDDTCFVHGVIVTLYGERQNRRRFINPDNPRLGGRSTMVLSNGCGHQYWLVEEDGAAAAPRDVSGTSY